MSRRWLLPVAWCIALLPAARAAVTATDTMEVTFRVTVADPGSTATVYVAGGAAELGWWDTTAVPLLRQADGSWSRTLALPFGEDVEFKITRGSWATEALDEHDVPLPNRHLRVGVATNVVVHVPKWRDEIPAAASSVTGELRYLPSMQGPGLLPRGVTVWLPPGYGASEKRFPVLYMHDGRNVFDASTSAFGAEWRVDEEADRLIREGRIGDLIVVAMDNTRDRSAEYGEDPAKTAAYMDFVVGVVKPQIDATYRTLPDRDHTAVMGSSMGGLISFLLAWKHPDVFAQAACLSPAFFTNWTDAVAADTNAFPPVRLYLDNGGVGLEKVLQPGCDTMLGLLQARGFRMGENLMWFSDPGAEHNERAWAARVWRPLEFMFGQPASAAPNVPTL